MAHIYRRRDTYHACYWWNGRRKRHTLKTKKRQVAVARLRDILSRLERGETALPTKTSCGEVLEAFIGHLRAHHRPKSVATDIYRLRECFGPVCPCLASDTENTRRTGRSRGASKRAGDISPFDLQFVEELTTDQISAFVEAKVVRHQIGPKTANEYREILHRLFAFAIKVTGIRFPGEPRRNPVTDVKRYKVKNPEICFLTLDQIEDQIAALAQWPHLQSMVAVLIYAGLRREELLWLTRRDLDLGRRLIHVRSKTIEGEFWQPKTGVNRSVPISASLLPYLIRHQANHLIWFFPSPQGCCWDPDNFSHKLRNVNRSLGLRWGCLDFRHTFGSQLAIKGESLYKISQLMGNSPEICRRHYAALTPESLVESVEFGVSSRSANLAGRR